MFNKHQPKDRFASYVLSLTSEWVDVIFMIVNICLFFFLRFIEIYLNVVNNISKSHPDRERYRCSKCHHIHENICCDEYQTPNFVPLFCSALIILPVDHFNFLETDIPTISSHLPYASSKNQSTIESEMGKKNGTQFMRISTQMIRVICLNQFELFLLLFILCSRFYFPTSNISCIRRIFFSS